MPDEVIEDLVVSTDEDDFEAAFNEAADKLETIRNKDSIEEEDLAALDVPSEPKETPDPDDDDDDAKAKAEDEAKTKAEAEPEPDPYAGMTPEVKAKFQALETDRDRLVHQVSSDKGRVTAFQKKVEGLQAEINTIRAGSTAGRSQPTSADIAEAMRGSDEDWQQFSVDYPEIARAIDKRFESTGKKTAEVIGSTLKPVTDRMAKADADAADTVNQERVAAVAETYPTWTEAVQTDDFEAWLLEQTPGTQGLAASDDPRDATELLGKYDAHLVANGQPSLRAVADDNLTEPDVDANKDDGKPKGLEPSEIERRRQQQLEDGIASPSKRAGIDADAEAEDEFEAAFNAFANRKEAKRA